MLRSSSHACWVALCALVLASFGTPVVGQTFTPIRVNVGGGDYTDSLGKLWIADTGYNDGTVGTTGTPIAGTNDPALYQSLRWDSEPAPELQYSFTVPNGTYRVNLLFAETFPPTYVIGARRFSVQMEGATVLPNIDVFAEAGAATALIKSATIAVTDGQLDIMFIHGVENPFVNAIEIIDATIPTLPENLTLTPASATQVNVSWTAATDDGGVARYDIERCDGEGCSDFARIASPVTNSYWDSGLSPLTTYRYRVRAFDSEGRPGPYSAPKAITTPSGAPLTSIIRVNAGGPAYTDSSSNPWSADFGANGGDTGVTGEAIAGTPDPALYQTVRWSGSTNPELEYAFTVPDGSYQLKLHFAETHSPAYTVGARIFVVQAEGITVIPALDVYAEAGAATALIKTVSTTVSDGTLNIRFAHGPTEHPFLNAIEVFAVGTGDVTAPSAPPGFSASAASSTTVSLDWSDSTDDVGVTGYAIERCAGPSCTDFLQVATATGSSYNDPGLASGTVYRYRVRAYDAGGNFSAYSSIATVTTQAGSGSDTEPPTAPGGLTAFAISNTDIQLTWTASIDGVGVANYLIERCEGTGCSSFAQIATPNGPAFKDVSTSGSTIYRYRVRAQDASLNLSGYSSIVTVTSAADVDDPSAPGNLTISVNAPGQVQLIWTDSADNVAVTAYLIERCLGTGCTGFAQLTSTTSPTLTDSGLPSNTTYRYRVRARDAANNTSSYSNVASATTLVGGGGSGTVSYLYDTLGRVTQVTEADGSTIQYTYDAAGNIKSTVRSGQP
jgi:YD repeat-containing protein